VSNTKGTGLLLAESTFFSGLPFKGNETLKLGHFEWVLLIFVEKPNLVAYATLTLSNSLLDEFSFI